MIRPDLVIKIVRIWIAFVLMFTTVGVWANSPVTTAQSSPVADEPPDEENDTQEPLLVRIAAIPQNPSNEIQMYMIQLEFGPDVYLPTFDLHQGQFELAVTSGSICYEVGTLEPGTTVTAIRLDPTATHPECPVTQNLDCNVAASAELPDTCNLVEGNVIFLPAGSSIRQIGDGEHRYGNKDSSITAIVYLTGYHFLQPGAGCAGGCW
jgi:hypothetical protein